MQFLLKNVFLVVHEMVKEKVLCWKYFQYCVLSTKSLCVNFTKSHETFFNCGLSRQVSIPESSCLISQLR